MSTYKRPMGEKGDGTFKGHQALIMREREELVAECEKLGWSNIPSSVIHIVGFNTPLV